MKTATPTALTCTLYSHRQEARAPPVDDMRRSVITTSTEAAAAAEYRHIISGSRRESTALRRPRCRYGTVIAPTAAVSPQPVVVAAAATVAIRIPISCRQRRKFGAENVDPCPRGVTAQSKRFPERADAYTQQPLRRNPLTIILDFH